MMVENSKKPKVTTPAEIDIVEEAVLNAVEKDNFAEAAQHLDGLRAPDQADLIEDLIPEHQDQILPFFTPEDQADILEELEEEEAAEIASRQGTDNLIRIVEEMEPDEAADLLGDIDVIQANQVLDAITEAEEVRPLLAYPDQSAGGIMTSLPFALLENMTVDQAVAHIRSEVDPDEDEIFYLFIVDQFYHLAGIVSIRQLLLSQPEALMSLIKEKDVIAIQATADQEEAARLMARYDLLALPVIDEENTLLGRITLDDSIEVLEDEATEDIYRLGGVPQGAPADISAGRAIKSRLPWLALNMFTAMASAAVLSYFENIIAQVAVLTAFLPLVAGVGGSAGTQVLTVTVRGLALGEIELNKGLKTLLREMLVGLFNGCILGIVVSIIALIWKGNPILGLIVGLSIFFNLICAGIAGVIVPLLMTKLKFDPALASPILVTTTTDTFGYLIYLSLASLLFIPYL